MTVIAEEPCLCATIHLPVSVVVAILALFVISDSMSLTKTDCFSQVSAKSVPNNNRFTYECLTSLESTLPARFVVFLLFYVIETLFNLKRCLFQVFT